MENSSKGGLNISVRSFITAIAVIFALMIHLRHCRGELWRKPNGSYCLKQ